MSFTPTNNDISRWIVKLEQPTDRPSIVFLSAIHGNEITGAEAIEEVFSTIKTNNIPLNGSVYGLRGNLQAIRENKRFIDSDLNRFWTLNHLNSLSENKHHAESKEVVELKTILDGFIEKSEAPLYFVDLHTTSSSSPPFLILDDTIRNRTFGNALPVTKVLGILEKLKGTILGYYGDKGPVTLVFEAGQHYAESSKKRHKAAIWLLLIQSGILDKKYIDVQKEYTLLEQSRKNAPKIVQTTYRHTLRPDDFFEMKPGFENFSPIKKGEILAHQNGLPLQASETANIFMPLYQKQGEDGYFIVKPISLVWVRLSKTLRKLKIEKILSILPGIHIDPDQKDSFIINRKVASFKSIELLHLFGFRREQERGKFTFVSRRPYDFKGPWD